MTAGPLANDQLGRRFTDQGTPANSAPALPAVKSSAAPIVGIFSDLSGVRERLKAVIPRHDGLGLGVHERSWFREAGTAGQAVVVSKSTRVARNSASRLSPSCCRHASSVARALVRMARSEARPRGVRQTSLARA